MFASNNSNTTTAMPSTIASTIMTTMVTTMLNNVTNSTTNGSTTAPRLPPQPRCPNSNDTEEERIIKLTAYSIVLVASFIGNLLIIAVILSNKKMKRPTNFFILNMALSDLVVPAMVISRQIILLEGEPKHRSIWMVDGTFGLILCKVVYFLQDVTTAVSIFSVILITVDRFIAVVYPMKHYIMSNNICKISIITTWLVAMGMHAIYLYSFELYNYHGTNICYPAWQKLTKNFNTFLRKYYVTLFCILVILPLVLMAVAYSIIIISLKRQSMPLGDSFSDRQKRQRAERERKVLRMAIAIIVSFFILWAPYNVFVFLELFLYSDTPIRPCNFDQFKYASFFCAYLNAAVNPAICFIFSQNFRQGFVQMLAKIGIVKRRNIPQQTTQVSMTVQNKAYEVDD